MKNAKDHITGITAGLDRFLMGLYGQVGINTRRAMRLCIALVPLMMLLVGSCRTSDMPASYGGSEGAAQFRTALFPDRVGNDDPGYTPAAGYVSRARKYVTAAPETMKLLTEKEIEYIFGAPEMERKDADARVWQYRAGECIVDVYMYGDEDSRAVTYVDSRGDDDCLKTLAQSI